MLAMPQLSVAQSILYSLINIGCGCKPIHLSTHTVGNFGIVALEIADVLPMRNFFIQVAGANSRTFT